MAYTHPSIDLPSWEQAATDPAVLLVDGHDIKVVVRAGHLVITDGPPGQPRTRKLAKVPRTVSRVVILAGHGMLTAEAIRWLNWAEIPWCMLDADGSVLADSGAARNDAALLRAQLDAPTGPKGLAVARRLISVKLRGQADNLRDMLPAPDAERFIRELATAVESAESLSSVMSMEANGAREYWRAWSGRVAVPWAPADLIRVPAHWRGFSDRPSLVSGMNKRASDPANACLNYAYKICESQAVLALHAAGLHPGLGISHADVQNRDSMALDLMEAARPLADRLVLTHFAPDGVIPYASGKPAYFDKRWVIEERDGTVRLLPPLTHSLTAHSADLAAVLLPHALAVAKMLTTNTVRLSGRRVPGQPREHYGLPKNRLRPGCNVAELVPDSVWEQIAPLIPVWTRPAGQTGRGPQIDYRTYATAMVGRFIVGLPWESVPVRRRSLTVRYEQWQESGIWDKIRAIFEQSGDISGLVE